MTNDAYMSAMHDAGTIYLDALEIARAAYETVIRVEKNPNSKDVMVAFTVYRTEEFNAYVKFVDSTYKAHLAWAKSHPA